MAKPISIGIAADTRDAAQAINKGIIDPLEDVVDSLDDVERNSDQLADELERQMRDAQRATDRYNESVKDAAKTADRAADDAKDSTREVGKEHEKLSSKIREEAQRARKSSKEEQDKTVSSTREQLRELGDEGRQNLSETLSSFDGSVQGFADGLQGTLGGIVSSLGPGGAIAGAIGALAIGLTVGQLTLNEEARQEFLDSVSEMTDEYLEFGQIGKRSADAVLSQLQAIATETDKGKTNLADWNKLSGQIGENVEDIASAYLTGGKPLDDIIDKTNEALAAERLRSAEITGSAGLIDAASSDRITNLEQESRLLGEQRDRIDQAREAQLLYLRAGGDEFELKVAQIESLNEAYDETASAIDDFSVTEGGALDPQKYIDGMNARAEALAEYKNDLASADLSTEAKTFLQTQGVDAAARFMAGYKSATPEQQAELNRIWSEAGRQNSGEYAEALDSNMPESVTGPRVDLLFPDEWSVRNKFQSLWRGGVNVPVNFVQRDGRSLP